MLDDWKAIPVDPKVFRDGGGLSRLLQIISQALLKKDIKGEKGGRSKKIWKESTGWYLPSTRVSWSVQALNNMPDMQSDGYRIVHPREIKKYPGVRSATIHCPLSTATVVTRLLFGRWNASFCKVVEECAASQLAMPANLSGLSALACEDQRCSR